MHLHHSNLRREAAEEIDDLFVVLEDDIDFLPQADLDLLLEAALIPVQLQLQLRMRAAVPDIRAVLQQMQAVAPDAMPLQFRQGEASTSRPRAM